MAEERLLTISDLVEMLQLSRSTVMGLLARGDIESLQIRRARRVRETAVREFIEARSAAQSRRPTRVGPGVDTGTAEEVGHASAQRSGRI